MSKCQDDLKDKATDHTPIISEPAPEGLVEQIAIVCDSARLRQAAQLQGAS